MKLKVGELYSKGKIFINEDIDYSNLKIENNYSFKRIKKCNVQANAYDTGDLIHIDLKIDAIVTLICSYSLEEFDYNLKCKDYIEISDNPQNDNGDIFIDKRPVINLDDYILPIIKCYIPIKPVKPGANPTFDK